MEKLVTSHRQISRIWMDFDKVTSYLYPWTELVFGLSLSVTVVAIFLAWRYTRRRNLESSRECVETESEVSKQKGRCLTEGKNIVDENNQKDLTDDIPVDGHGLKQLHDPSDKMKVPKGCPMAHMFDLAKMSKLLADENPEESERIEELREDDGNLDPQHYMSHIQSEVKRSQQRVALKKIEEEMSAEQKAREREIQHEQLEAIFKMMAEHKEKFGVSDMDDMQSQVKLYM